MRKNLILAAGFAVAIFTASCDNNAGTETTDAPVTASQELAVQPVDNPNVAAEGEIAPAGNAPVMTFEQTEYDFGTIKQGEVVNHTFTFTNTGESPLIIENASATCGCTVPQWTTEPVAPGEQGQIVVQFNSTGKAGQQFPTVTVRANTEPNIVKVSLKGNVATNSIPTAGPEGPVRRN
ncbi:MAG: DUF1573 domain-containing protein [Hymenobacteraceae bacterium]|nr:DUF1573 domain-containing protein [Hymenobacteraceae bacterium]MDX5482054.1 DUF1573 domain-containing protein [Hymenobacteraceae bacterium]